MLESMVALLFDLVGEIMRNFILLALSMLLAAPALYADEFQVGTRVRCKWQKVGNYYNGTIARKNGSEVFIQYDDGDTENTQTQYCQILKTNTTTSNNTSNTNRPSNAAPTVRKIEASSSGWQKWTIQTSDGKGVLEADGSGQHMSWDMEWPGEEVEIVTCIQGSQWWMKWQFRYGGNQLIAEASSKTEWKIDSTYNRLKVNTRWSNDTSQWEIKGKKGTIKVTRRGGSWPSYEIEDNMPGEDIHMKMAAFFAIIVATEMPH